jgi:hypothetical protein
LEDDLFCGVYKCVPVLLHNIGWMLMGFQPMPFSKGDSQQVAYHKQIIGDNWWITNCRSCNTADLVIQKKCKLFDSNSVLNIWAFVNNQCRAWRWGQAKEAQEWRFPMML